MNEIILGDCLEVIAGMEPASVDFVFGSPPYEDCRTYGIGFRLKGQEWVDWMVKVHLAAARACKGLVAFVVEGKTEDFRWSASPALYMADLHRAGLRLRKPPVFHRVGIPGSGGPDWFRNDYEFIVCTSPGKLPWSDNTAMGHAPKWGPGGEMSYRQSNGSRRNKWGKSPKQVVDAVGPRSRSGERKSYRRPGDDEPIPANTPGYVPPCTANPGNAIEETYSASEVAAMLEEESNWRHVNVGGGLMGSDLACENEAPFPESLVEWFVLSCCPPGGTVLDPFSGSGTTAAVAKKHGRNYIGIDIRQSQVDLANRRLAGVTPPLFA